MGLVWIRRLSVVVAITCVLASSHARSQVLTTITIDGDMADWSAVLADGRQTAEDGPAGALSDLDAPVPSTGRDLLTFAWTYDANHLFFYVGRVGSASNLQRFWFYIDTDEDGLQESGEPVVGVSWWGRNRTTTVDLYMYTAASPAGDPLGDPTGLADGWTMPGTVALVANLETVRGGARNGVEMESRVAWGDLGIPPGTPVRFHVSSSASTNLPAQVHDNMAGPGGSIGTTRIAGIRIDPSAVSADTVPAGRAVLAHTVTNTGASPDRAAFETTSSGDFTPSAVAYWRDVDADGAIGPADALLSDTTGDGRPDVGPIPAGATIAVLVVVDAPASAIDGQSISLVVSAYSEGLPTVSDTASDTVTIRAPAVTLVKSVSTASAVPGETLTYTVSYTSSGAVDAHEVVLVDPVPADLLYLPGSSTGPGTVIEFSHDDGATFDGSETAPVTHVRWSLTAPLAPGESGSVSFRAQVR
jgi:uncharacterized repeat protein (TIGR01451 family)